jgi:hypothetical protein
VEVTLTIVALWLSCSRGSSAWVMASVPMTFTRNVVSHDSGSPSDTESPSNEPPATLINASHADSPAAKSPTAATSVISRTAVAHPVSLASAANCGSRRATATTSHPAFARRRAVAAPIPLLAPVTTAHFLIVASFHVSGGSEALTLPRL